MRCKPANARGLKTVMPRKRTGDIGPLHLSILPTGASVEWKRIDFPDGADDDQIAYLFAQRFQAAYNKSPLLPDLLPRVDEVCPLRRRLDALLKTASGDKWLELMAIKPIEYYQTNVDHAPSIHNQYEIAQFIHAKLNKKSNRYKSAKPGNDMFLLIYLDDWRFQPGNDLITLLRYWSHRKPHIFKAIFYYMPTDATDGDISLIFPTGNDWNTFDPEQYRRTVINLDLDPAKWQVSVRRTP
jgi:hypothetical protein